MFRVEGFGTRSESVPGAKVSGRGRDGDGDGDGDGEVELRGDAHPATVHGVDWNAAGSALATSAGDGRVRVWVANVQTGVWEERAQLVGE